MNSDRLRNSSGRLGVNMRLDVLIKGSAQVVFHSRCPSSLHLHIQWLIKHLQYVKFTLQSKYNVKLLHPNILGTSSRPVMPSGVHLCSFAPNVRVWKKRKQKKKGVGFVNGRPLCKNNEICGQYVGPDPIILQSNNTWGVIDSLC